MFKTTRVRVKCTGLTISTKTSPIIVVPAVSVPNDGHLIALTGPCQLPRWYLYTRQIS